MKYCSDAYEFYLKSKNVFCGTIFLLGQYETYDLYNPFDLCGDGDHVPSTNTNTS